MKNEAAYQSILTDIDRATEPSVMTKALDWLEDMTDELKNRCEALRDEIRQGNRDADELEEF